MGFWRREGRWAALLAGGFLAAYHFPISWLGQSTWMPAPLIESLALVRWYAREHVLLCLVPAFFIAGAIGVFITHDAVIRYLGPSAHKLIAYGVASVSGSILAVCSCTVLPLFAGIYRRGAGLGPATTFLYAGPAINVLAIILTARVLGFEIGVARAVGAVVFSIVVGGTMALLFHADEQTRLAAPASPPPPASGRPGGRPLWQTALFFGSMVAILIFANWGEPRGTTGVFASVHSAKWWLTGLAALALASMLVMWYGLPWLSLLVGGGIVAGTGILLPGHAAVPFTIGAVGIAGMSLRAGGELEEWVDSSWTFAKQILPLLLVGVLAAGLLLGRPGGSGLVPATWVSTAVGGNSFSANLFASAAGALMYFATLTEIPILEGLLAADMGKGPALALLLAGPALSLPNMIVIRSVLGTRKTLVFIGLTIAMATLSGTIYGWLGT
jgi:uncharacterized membrane protein YraQ (UPF0718 family)